MTITITSFTPNRATPATAPGMHVTIHGTGFSPGCYVRIWGSNHLCNDSFDGNAASYISPTQIDLILPNPYGERTDSFRVLGPGFSEASNEDVIFTVAAAPPALEVSSVAPNHGPTTGGTTITVTGDGFLAGAEVRVGSGAWVAATVVSLTQLTVVSPSGAAGLVAVSVRQPSVTAVVLADAFTYVTPVAAIPSPLGTDGQFYMDISDPASPTLYGPRTDGDWGDGLS